MMNVLKFDNKFDQFLSIFFMSIKNPTHFYNIINHFQFHDYSNLDTGVKMLIKVVSIALLCSQIVSFLTME